MFVTYLLRELRRRIRNGKLTVQHNITMTITTHGASAAEPLDHSSGG
ncbi:MAG: hypothetical protein ABSA93_15425 [Streptosporangiaceae bacterium]|jgi:hypothetical protein